MKLSSELIDKIVECIYNSEEKLFNDAFSNYTEEDATLYADIEFDIDGMNVYVEIKLFNLKSKSRHYKTPYPEPNEDSWSLSFEYKVNTLRVGDVDVDEDCIDKLNENINGNVELEDCEWK